MSYLESNTVKAPRPWSLSLYWSQEWGEGPTEDRADGPRSPGKFLEPLSVLLNGHNWFKYAQYFVTEHHKARGCREAWEPSAPARKQPWWAAGLWSALLRFLLRTVPAFQNEISTDNVFRISFRTWFPRAHRFNAPLEERIKPLAGVIFVR